MALLRFIIGLLGVTGLFAGVMMLPAEHDATQAAFVPYSGPYHAPPPPPRPLLEDVPAHSAALHWVPGHWAWVGNGYSWIGGKLVRQPKNAHDPNALRS